MMGRVIIRLMDTDSYPQILMEIGVDKDTLVSDIKREI